MVSKKRPEEYGDNKHTCQVSSFPYLVVPKIVYDEKIDMRTKSMFICCAKLISKQVCIKVQNCECHWATSTR